MQIEEEVNFPALLDQGIDKLLCIDQSYEKGDIETQRQIIGSMYPEKLTFDGFHFRTTRINDAVSCIYSLSAAFDEKEKGQSGNISSLSSQVGKTGFEPATPWSQTRCATGLRYFPNFFRSQSVNCGMQK